MKHRKHQHKITTLITRNYSILGLQLTEKLFDIRNIISNWQLLGPVYRKHHAVQQSSKQNANMNRHKNTFIVSASVNAGAPPIMSKSPWLQRRLFIHKIAWKYQTSLLTWNTFVSHKSATYDHNNLVVKKMLNMNNQGNSREHMNPVVYAMHLNIAIWSWVADCSSINKGYFIPFER